MVNTSDFDSDNDSSILLRVFKYVHSIMVMQQSPKLWLILIKEGSIPSVRANKKSYLKIQVGLKQTNKMNLKGFIFEKGI